MHENRTNPPHVDPLPPIHGLPSHRSDPWDVDDVSMGRADRGASIAPTALWCPYGSRPTAGAPPPPLPRRSCQDSSLANSPRGERLRSEGTNNALRRTERALRSVLVVVCVVMNVIEAPVHPRFTVPRRGALQPRQASTASSRKSSEILFLVVETRPSEARRARQSSRADVHGYDRLQHAI